MNRRSFLGRSAALGLAGAGAGCGGAMGTAVDSAVRMVQAAPTVKGAMTDLDEAQEIEIGRAVTAAVGTRYTVLRDPALTRYVAFVGCAVAAVSERPDLRYYFVVLDAPEVNAFAAPGGYVFVTRGTLALVPDEATLGAVLGHEVGHIALRHHVETIKAQKRKELGVLGVSAAASQTGAAPFAQAIGLAADAVSEQVLLKGFSRKEESEADRVGQEYAVRAGYDPAGMRDFLALLLAREGKDERLSRFFSTHPGTRERLEEQERILRAGAGTGQRNRPRYRRAVGPTA